MTRDEREKLKALTDDLLEAAREAEGKLAADDGTHPSDAPWHYHRGESAAYRKAALLTHQRVPSLLRDLETAEGLLRGLDLGASNRTAYVEHGMLCASLSTGTEKGSPCDCGYAEIAAFLGEQP